MMFVASALPLLVRHIHFRYSRLLSYVNFIENGLVSRAILQPFDLLTLA
jgi:hypothetical protein